MSLNVPAHLTQLERTLSQRLQVQVDTGSSELWLIADCQTCSSDAELDSSQSSTFKASRIQAGIDYVRHSLCPVALLLSKYQGIGSISGVIAEDVVTIANLTVHAQSFIAASNITADFDKTPPSGLIGRLFHTTFQTSR